MDLSSLSAGGWWAWFLTGVGFFLVAAGVPASSFAMFVIAVRVSQESGFTWQEAAAFAGSATVAGHVASYYLFRWLGARGTDFAARVWPRLPDLLQRISSYLQRGWAFALILRWVGTGYTQVFWLMGMSGRPWFPVICAFLANDYAWAAFWCATVGYAFQKVQVLTRYVPLVAAVCFLGGAAGLVLSRYSGRK